MDLLEIELSTRAQEDEEEKEETEKRRSCHRGIYLSSKGVWEDKAIPETYLPRLSYRKLVALEEDNVPSSILRL